jgi:uncharacterized protein
MDKRLRLDDFFDFGCSDQLECFGRCCVGAPNIWITPCDIVRIKNNMGVSSREFLERYTITAYSEKDGYPVIWLKINDTGSCPFSIKAGCAVYPDRPWVCRMFPLVPIWNDDNPAPVVDGPDPQFVINRVDYCMAHGRGTPFSITQWREKQGVLLYEAVNAEWKKVTHHKKFRTRNFLKGPDADLFFMGCYDIDGFRNTVFEKEFVTDCAVGNNVARRIGPDDTKFLKFSLAWLRHVLFGEDAPIPFA